MPLWSRNGWYRRSLVKGGTMRSVDERLASLTPEALQYMADSLLAGRSGGQKQLVQPRPRSDSALPLSIGQERLWFLEQLGLVGAAYNMPVAFQLDGALDDSALEKSLQAL